MSDDQLGLRRYLRLINNSKEWQRYKCNLVYSDVNIQHKGQPERFPCWVYTTDNEVTYNTCWIYYMHRFLYLEDLATMVQEMKGPVDRK